MNNQEIIAFQLTPNPHTCHVLMQDVNGYRSEPIVAWGLQEDGSIVPLTVGGAHGTLISPSEYPGMEGVRVFEDLPQKVKDEWLAKGVRL